MPRRRRAVIHAEGVQSEQLVGTLLIVRLGRIVRRGVAAFEAYFCGVCVCAVSEMRDYPVSNADLYLKAADEFSDLAKTAPTPFMRAYFERVALRYRSSEGELKEGESAPISELSGA
jgi:hypothetical protein